MIVYKSIDEYSRDTGKLLGTRLVFDYYICDFTGKKLDDYYEPNLYSIDYNSNDPCFGDGEGEKWLYSWKEEYRDYYFELFAQSDYVFSNKNYDWDEVFVDLIEKARKELDKIYSLDYLLRWSRGKMLEKVLKEGTYKFEQFVNLNEI